MTQTEEFLLNRINYAAYMLRSAKSLDIYAVDALRILDETLEQYDTLAEGTDHTSAMKD
jgi:hypothetical protein